MEINVGDLFQTSKSEFKFLDDSIIKIDQVVLTRVVYYYLHDISLGTFNRNIKELKHLVKIPPVMRELYD